MKNPLKVALSALTIGAIALSLSACTPDESTKPTKSPTPTVAPTPLLTFEKLSGDNTQLVLSKAFAVDLKQSGAKVDATGDATYGKLGGGVGLSFQINGGNVSYYNPKVH